MQEGLGSLALLDSHPGQQLPSTCVACVCNASPPTGPCGAVSTARLPACDREAAVDGDVQHSLEPTVPRPELEDGGEGLH